MNRSSASPAETETVRKRITLTGIVQGVGLRPFVYRRAHQFGLAGWVANSTVGVTIEVEGTSWRVGQFLEGFANKAPSPAAITEQHCVDLPVVGETMFRIAESASDESRILTIPPDLATCDQCLSEIFTPSDRRFAYPFTNCTRCGPRFTIVYDLPYDRTATSMVPFSMCDRCRNEFDDANHRRFHAQPNACHECGPRLSFEIVERARDSQTNLHLEPTTHTDALDRCKSAIAQGQIVAIKGIGGFHLACDATNAETVRRLRQRKQRPDQPFAVMVRDVESARAFAEVSDEEAGQLEDVARPIVLLAKRTVSTSNNIADQVAPAQATIGVLLPYSPLHHLIVEDAPPLVMTSGNLSGEPIARSNQEARSRLSRVSDSFLFHDREIEIACDDSVMRVVGGRSVPIRRSRGYVPLPLQLNSVGPDVLAVGSDLKAAICLTKGRSAILGPHIGDLENLQAQESLLRCVEHFLKLYQVKPDAIAADLHPEFHSRKLAETIANRLNIPLLLVQHHEAHLASLIAEVQLSADIDVVGCCFDGTGFGRDGTVWGGEFLVRRGRRFMRAARLKPILLPGGDACIRNPYRAALAYLRAHQIPWEETIDSVKACPEEELVVLRQQMERGFNSVKSSSIGRLIDAVCSLIGLRHRVTYEGQAAMELEALAGTAQGGTHPPGYTFKLEQREPIEIDPVPVLSAVVKERRAQVDPGIIAARFQHAMVEMIVDVCDAVAKPLGIQTVGLTGGVFQNAWLLGQSERRLAEVGYRVLTHRVVPPNDGGIALGQAMIARDDLRSSDEGSALSRR